MPTKVAAKHGALLRLNAHAGIAPRQRVVAADVEGIGGGRRGGRVREGGSAGPAGGDIQHLLAGSLRTLAEATSASSGRMCASPISTMERLPPAQVKTSSPFWL